MNNEQLKAAEKSMIEWLSDPHELGQAPAKIECTKEFDLYGLHYYVFRFKTSLFDKWKLAVCGGYEGNELEHSGNIFSDMKEYQDKTAVSDATEIVERIRAYWIEQAHKQEELNDRLKANNDFRTADEIPAEKIESQFVKTDNRYYLKVGEIDCPTGNIIAADPLAYLPSRQFSPVLEQAIPAGKYPVIVSICRNNIIGIRMCTAMLKIKDKKAVKYIKANATAETGIEFKDGILQGFPVDAGMTCFCDVQVAEEYSKFIDNWYKLNPNKNHYDNYFSAFFAESYESLPAYQREDGDFIEWANPETGNKLVMVSSGLGDGFYCAYYGYDEVDNLCQIIIPMVNPSIFE